MRLIAICAILGNVGDVVGTLILGAYHVGEQPTSAIFQYGNREQPFIRQTTGCGGGYRMGGSDLRGIDMMALAEQLCWRQGQRL